MLNLIYSIWHCCRIFLTTNNCDIAGHSDLTDMTLWYFRRMLLLLVLMGSAISSNETAKCKVCQAPVIQDRHVPWTHLLSSLVPLALGQYVFYQRTLSFQLHQYRCVFKFSQMSSIVAKTVAATYCVIHRFLESTVCVGRVWIESLLGSGDPFIRME